MERIYLSKEEVDANVDSMMACRSGHTIGRYWLFARQRHTFFDRQAMLISIAWGRLYLEKHEAAYMELCDILCETSGVSLQYNNTYERRRQLFFEMWDYSDLKYDRRVRSFIEIGVMGDNTFNKPTEEEENIIMQAAQSFMVNSKKLIHVLASQDLSGEEIRQFVKKVFNL